MIRCVIIDDEKPARDLLKAYVKKISHLELIGDYPNPMDAMSVISSQKIDLILLDIQMPGLTGLDFIKTLSNKPAIILTTAYPQYAIEGFELDVQDYLMKPISFERFLKAINKLKTGQAPVTTPQKEVEKEVEKGEKPDFLYFKADGQKHRVNANSILFIEGLKEYVKVITEKESIITLASLRNLEEELPVTFLRVHKSFIINKDKVNSYSNSQIIINGHKIPVGKMYAENVMKELY
ncbi:MAG: LytR/AlgR family response regulator transcription factor [Bacteroidota bacterium]